MQKLARICIERPVFAVMLSVALVVVGAFSFFGLGVDLLPKVDLPVVTISVIDPGASPQEVESEITKKVEDAVNTISGIDQIRSTSVEGLSLTFVSFQLEKNGDLAAQQVRDNVNLISDLPANARTPTVQKLDTGATPILQIALSANRPLAEVTQVAEERFKKSLESLSGVGQVQVLGGAKRELRITIDPERMRAHGVTVAEIAR